MGGVWPPRQSEGRSRFGGGVRGWLTRLSEPSDTTPASWLAPPLRLPGCRLPAWTSPLGTRIPLCLGGTFPPSTSAFSTGEASMERLLAQLCETSVLQPLPVWEGDTTGHCFTQLVLSALPHALLAVLSACHWGTPRWVETGARHLSMCACRPHLKPAYPRQFNQNSEVSGVGQK